MSDNGDAPAIIGQVFVPAPMAADSPAEFDSEAAAPDVVSPLLDLTGVELEVLRNLPESALAQAIQRVLTDRGGDSEIVAGFNSAI